MTLFNMGNFFSFGRNDLREKASDVETIRKAWKNWEKMFENENQIGAQGDNTHNNTNSGHPNQKSTQNQQVQRDGRIPMNLKGHDNV